MCLSTWPSIIVSIIVLRDKNCTVGQDQCKAEPVGFFMGHTFRMKCDVVLKQFKLNALIPTLSEIC